MRKPQYMTKEPTNTKAPKQITVSIKRNQQNRAFNRTRKEIKQKKSYIHR